MIIKCAIYIRILIKNYLPLKLRRSIFIFFIIKLWNYIFYKLQLPRTCNSLNNGLHLEALKKQDGILRDGSFSKLLFSFITKVKLLTVTKFLLPYPFSLVILIPSRSFNEGLYFLTHKGAAEASACPSFLICRVPFKTVNHYYRTMNRATRAKRSEYCVPFFPLNPIIRSMATLTLSALSYFSFNSIEHCNWR